MDGQLFLYDCSKKYRGYATTYLPHPIPLKTDGLSLNIQL